MKRRYYLYTTCRNFNTLNLAVCKSDHFICIF